MSADRRVWMARALLLKRWLGAVRSGVDAFPQDPKCEGKAQPVLFQHGLRVAAGIVALVLSVSLAGPTPTALAAQTVYDVGDVGGCDVVERVMSVIASEATRQPFAAQVEVARAVVTKGACTDDESYLAGLRVARIAAESGMTRSHHYRAFYNLYSFQPDLLAQWRAAATIALTEVPRVARYHFDRADAPRYAWWDSPKACPNGDFVIGDIRFC